MDDDDEKRAAHNRRILDVFCRGGPDKELALRAAEISALGSKLEEAARARDYPVIADIATRIVQCGFIVAEASNFMHGAEMLLESADMFAIADDDEAEKEPVH